MSQKQFETVSDLVDNYIENDQLDSEQLDELINNEQMSKTWDRYHLIGDVLRDEVQAPISSELSLNIASAIAAEPTVLAPKKSTVKEKINAKIIKLAKPFGQVAIAASAAALMIVGVQQNIAEQDQIIPSEVLQTTPFAGIADPVSLNVGQSQNAQRLSYEQQQRRFQALLADHEQSLKLKQIVQTSEQQAQPEAELLNTIENK